MNKILLSFFCGLTLLFFFTEAFATPCGELIYNKNGWLRKYEVLPLTLGEAFKKHGSSSSSKGTIESTTASVDLGVSTGGSVSWGQSLSTRGECKWAGLFASAETYHRYLAQNLDEIKKEMALGGGGHLELLASAHDCRDSAHAGFARAMQRHLPEFIDYSPEQAAKFGDQILQVISQDLPESCLAI